MLASFYRVQISATEGAAPRNGFVDPNTVERYRLGGEPVGFNYAAAVAKERANIRWEGMIGRLGLMANCYISNIVTVGSDASTAPNPLSFTLEIERGDSVLYTEDELNPGAALTGIAAIKRCIARALTDNRIGFGDIYDNTPIQTEGTTVASPRTGLRVDRIEVGQVSDNLLAAEVTIAVTRIDNIG
jgi:hypothetical protein